MKEELKLEHLAPYLPYRLQCHLMGEMINDDADPTIPRIFYIIGADTSRVKISKGLLIDAWIYEEVFPILRPLSDIIEYTEHFNLHFRPIDELMNHPLCNDNESELASLVMNSVNECPYWMIEKLLYWNFDIFGLIEKGLAIDIKTLEEI